MKSGFLWVVFTKLCLTCDRKKRQIHATDTHLTSDQIRLVTQSCLTLCDPMNRSTPGLPVHHQLTEFTETHVHWVSDAIQPSHPLSSPSPPAPNPSQCHIHSWVLFLLWLHPFILSGVISPLIFSSILGTYWPGEFLFQYPIILPFILFMGFSRQEYWSGLPFPSPVDHIVSDLSTMTRASWVAPHGMP